MYAIVHKKKEGDVEILSFYIAFDVVINMPQNRLQCQLSNELFLLNFSNLLL